MAFTPCLKRGVRISHQPNLGRVLVGTRFRSVGFPEYWSEVSTRRVLGLMDGSKDLAELAKQSGIDTSQLMGLIKELQKHDLVDLVRTPISYLKRYNPELGYIEVIEDVESKTEDYAIQSFLNRIQVECDAVSFNPGDIDGGRSVVLKRREFSIMIFGNGKLVNAVVGLLSASGFSNVNVINRLRARHPNLKIREVDIAGGFVTNAHIGQSRRKTILELKSRTALFDSDEAIMQKPDLIISIGTPSPDSLQRWSSENTPYLLVEISSSAEVRVGPLVIPGKSPCFRCVSLSESEGFGDPGSIPINQSGIELGSVLSFAVASAIAADVAEICAQNKTVFLATSFTYSMRNFHNPERITWRLQPNCGCNWS